MPLSPWLWPVWGGVVIANGGFNARFSPAVVAYDSQRNPAIPYRGCSGNLDIGRTPCLLGDATQPPTVLFWGDSHALAWAPIVNEMAQGKRTLAFSYHPACPPLVDVINPVSSGCVAYNDEVAKLLARESTIRKVVLHASWTSYSLEPGQYRLQDRHGQSGNDKVFGEAFNRTVRRLRELGKEVVILGPTPGAPAELPLRLAFAALSGSGETPHRMPYSDYRLHTEPFYKVANAVSADQGVTILDPSRYLCDSSFCNYLHEGKLLYRDAGHLSYPGALFLSRQEGLAALL